jgi:hypothetical protein
MARMWIARTGLILHTAVSDLAQGVPSSITCEGEPTDSAGDPLADTYVMQFKLFDSRSADSGPAQPCHPALSVCARPIRADWNSLHRYANLV